MDGSAELLQLAHLLRVGAHASRDIGKLRPDDAEAIEQLADEAERMAQDIEAMVGNAEDGVSDGAR